MPTQRSRALQVLQRNRQEDLQAGAMMQHRVHKETPQTSRYIALPSDLAPAMTGKLHPERLSTDIIL